MSTKPVYNEYETMLEEDFSVAYRETAGAQNHTMHMHQEFELLLCLSDDMFCRVEKKMYDVSANTLLLFNSMDLHHYGPKQPDGENHRYVLYFKPSYIGTLSASGVNLLDCFLFRPFSDGTVLPVSEEQSKILQRQIRKIITIQNQPEEECYGRSFYIQLALAELLLMVNTFYRSYHSISYNTASEHHRWVYDMMEYIHQNYSEDLSLDVLAGKFYINKYYLCEIFKSVAGTSPSQYVINCRITKAKELLMHGCSVEQVCDEVGFHNLSHFSRTFKERVGQSPKQYQKSIFEKQSALSF